jgi:hypothetical protein
MLEDKATLTNADRFCLGVVRRRTGRGREDGEEMEGQRALDLAVTTLAMLNQDAILALDKLDLIRGRERREEAHDAYEEISRAIVAIVGRLP